MLYRNGEVWFDLRSKLTPELTSRKTMLGFLPELNMITDDFMQLLKNNRNANGEVKEFDQYAKRYGLESVFVCLFFFTIFNKMFLFIWRVLFKWFDTFQLVVHWSSAKG